MGVGRKHGQSWTDNCWSCRRGVMVWMSVCVPPPACQFTCWNPNAWHEESGGGALEGASVLRVEGSRTGLAIIKVQQGHERGWRSWKSARAPSALPARRVQPLPHDSGSPQNAAIPVPCSWTSQRRVSFCCWEATRSSWRDWGYNKSIHSMSPALAGRPLGKPESLLVTCNVQEGRRKPRVDTGSAAFPHRESLLLWLTFLEHRCYYNVNRSFFLSKKQFYTLPLSGIIFQMWCVNRN